MDRDTAEPNAEESPPDVSLADLVDDLEAVVWEADPETFDFIFVNRRGTALLGYERAEWYEHGFWAERLIHPDDRAATVATCQSAVDERRDHQLEYRALTASGRVVWLRDFIRVILGDDGRVRALRGMMLDVLEPGDDGRLVAPERYREDLALGGEAGEALDRDEPVDPLQGRPQRRGQIQIILLPARPGHHLEDYDEHRREAGQVAVRGPCPSRRFARR